MDINMWQEKIATLPDFAQQQISDYIDFLVQKYQQPQGTISELEKETLEKRYAEFKEDSSGASSLAEVKNRLNSKYGLSDQD
ncbi:MAG TPA: DUF2281 domain-containing protein [Adhaeribacter sp.]|nr:DUF2281 domain-containing protein [Adhaeribacter sp.]